MAALLCFNAMIEALRVRRRKVSRSKWLADGRSIRLSHLDVQGNRAGAIGCGDWNPACGGLNLVLVWEIAYCIIAGLVIIIFPFFIFYYENDDEVRGCSGVLVRP